MICMRVESKADSASKREFWNFLELRRIAVYCVYIIMYISVLCIMYISVYVDCSQPVLKQVPIAVILEPEAPKEPPPELEFIAEPPSISSMEL